MVFESPSLVVVDFDSTIATLWLAPERLGVDTHIDISCMPCTLQLLAAALDHVDAFSGAPELDLFHGPHRPSQGDA